MVILNVINLSEEKNAKTATQIEKSTEIGTEKNALGHELSKIPSANF